MAKPGYRIWPRIGEGDNAYQAGNTETRNRTEKKRTHMKAMDNNEHQALSSGRTAEENHIVSLEIA